MDILWTQEKIQQYVDDGTEESLSLEYKGAASLSKTDKAKIEIAKDVSAMANSAGGLILYGVKEFDDENKKHLPEKIDPIDRKSISREWLEQIINNIKPHIDGLIIFPVSLDSGTNDVVYVVEVPQGSTAHQATDYRYYKRTNFLAKPMEDYEIRDVMNRAAKPNATALFSYEASDIQTHRHQYRLKVGIENLSDLMIKQFQLEFTFPTCVGFLRHQISSKDNIDLGSVSAEDYLITYRSKIALFPKQMRDITNELVWDYAIAAEQDIFLSELERIGRPAKLEWTLYADEMKPKYGIVPFLDLKKF